MAINNINSEDLFKAESEPEAHNKFVFKLSAPFIWEGKTYESFNLDFNSLTGKDMATVEREMADNNEFALSPEYSVSYLLRLAARAAKVDSAVFENLPLRDANGIRAKTRAFLLRGGF